MTRIDKDVQYAEGFGDFMEITESSCGKSDKRISLKRIKELFEETVEKENNGDDKGFYEKLKTGYIAEITEISHSPETDKIPKAMEFISYELMVLAMDRFYRDDINTIKFVLIPASEEASKYVKTDKAQGYQRAITDLARGMYGMEVIDEKPETSAGDFMKMFNSEKI